MNKIIKFTLSLCALLSVSQSTFAGNCCGLNFKKGPPISFTTTSQLDCNAIRRVMVVVASNSHSDLTDFNCKSTENGQEVNAMLATSNYISDIVLPNPGSAYLTYKSALAVGTLAQEICLRISSDSSFDRTYRIETGLLSTGAVGYTVYL